MSKQVTQAAQEAAQNPQNRNLYFKVDTLNAKGEKIGERIVDLHHFGTRNWLSNHIWWAVCNGHRIETSMADEKAIENYLAGAKKALADKFNKAA